jgi:hypothetical protein
MNAGKRGKLGILACRAGVIPTSLLAATLAACAPPPDTRPAVEVTTRSGIVLVIARVELNYERICGDSSYKAEGDSDAIGLRYYVGGDPAQRGDPRSIFGAFKEIPWSAIAGVTFVEPVGIANGFCGNLPDAIMADIAFKDGHQERRALFDTTDRGLAGITEHGPVLVPLRSIAGLKPIPPENWSWLDIYDPPTRDTEEVKKREARIALRVSKTDKSQQKLATPFVVIFVRKTSGDRELGPITFQVTGLPILRGGVRFEVPWIDLSHVGVSNGYPRIATLTFNDRHEESGELPEDGKVEDGLGLSKDVELRDIAAIDVSVAKTP